MDRNRAKEILDAPHMIQVRMAGIPVYIQKVNETEQTAQIFPIDEPDHEQIVPLQQLVEEEFR